MNSRQALEALCFYAVGSDRDPWGAFRRWAALETCVRKTATPTQFEELRTKFGPALQELCSFLILQKAIRLRVRFVHERGTLTFSLTQGTLLTFECLAGDSLILPRIGPSNLVQLVVRAEETAERDEMPALCADVADFLEVRGSRSIADERRRVWRGLWFQYNEHEIAEADVFRDWDVAPCREQVELGSPPGATGGASITAASEWGLGLVICRALLSPAKTETKAAASMGSAKPPALIRAVHEGVISLLCGAAASNPKNSLVYVVDTESIASSFVAKGVKLFESLTAHKLLRHLIYEGHRQYFDEAASERKAGQAPGLANRLVYAGGFSEIAVKLGLSSSTARADVRDLLRALDRVRIQAAPECKEEHLIILREPRRDDSSDKRPEVVVTLGDVLLPDYVHVFKRLTKTRYSARMGRRLVPILDNSPPLGRRNDWAAQSVLSLMVVQTLRDGAVELVNHGGVRIDEATWQNLAKAARVSTPVTDVVKRWISGGFLEQVGEDRFHLAVARRELRTLLEEGGEQTLKGRRRAGVRRKRTKLRKAKH